MWNLVSCRRNWRNLALLAAPLIAALALSGLAISFVRGQGPVSRLASSDTLLEEAFLGALTNLTEARKHDRSTVLDCTQFFSEFYRYRQVEPYIAFFNSIEISAIRVDMNQRHYVYWEIGHDWLWSKGYRGFLRNDRLVIGFTTTSAASSEITSFKATVLNSDHI